MPEDTTAKHLISVPDKVVLLWLGVTTWAITIAVSWFVFQGKLDNLLESDVRIQVTVEKLAENLDDVVGTQNQQALDMNTLTVKFDIFLDAVNSDPGI